MHFFNPVPVMALVEVVATPRTDGPRWPRDGGARRAAGQDAGRGGGHAGIHRQSGGAAVLPRGAAASGRRRGRRRRPSTRRCARPGSGWARSSSSTPSAWTSTSPSARRVWEAFGRSPRYLPHSLQRVLVQAGRLGRKTGRRLLRLDRWGTWRSVGRAGAGRCSPGAQPLTRRRSRPGAGHGGQRGRVRGGGSDRQPGGHRYRHAPRDQLAEGPLAWGEKLGLGRAVATLDALAANAPDARYAVVPLLRSLAGSGGSFFAAPDECGGREPTASVSGSRLRHGRPAARHRGRVAGGRGGAVRRPRCGFHP